MIIVGGDVLVDLIQSGRSDMGLSFDGMRGGSSYNTALAAGRLGPKTGFLSPLSTDYMGRFLADGLTASGVTPCAAPNDAPTSLAVVTLTDGQPSYQFYRQGVADRQVSVAQLQADFPTQARLLHVSSLALADGADADAWAAFFGSVSVLTCLDPNIRPLLIPDRDGYMQRLRGMLQTVDVLKLSDEDLEWLYPHTRLPDAITALLADTKAALTIVTKGAEGAEAYWGCHHTRLPAAPVTRLVDTVGAGDTFMGAVLAALHDNAWLDRASVAGLKTTQVTAMLTRAARAAALNCGRKGCNPPTKAEVDAF